MIIALLALALAMIVGGSLAAFFGWDIVLVERGWTMVIAGSVCASAGALLLGITGVISRLGRIQTELSLLQMHVDQGTPVSPQLPGDIVAGAMAGAAVTAPAVDLFGEGSRKPEPEAASKPQDEKEPELPNSDESKASTAEANEGLFGEPAPAAAVVPFPSKGPDVPVRDEEDEEERKVPDFLMAERRDTYVEPRLSRMDQSTDRDTSDRRDEDAGDDRATPAAWPEADPEAERETARAVLEPEPADEEPEAAEEPRPATVVGTYNSGDNKYVMFSDGSIEAQTPGGVFRFKSLDELKEFIAAGGETNSSSAI
jgi:hypothetical protein